MSNTKQQKQIIGILFGIQLLIVLYWYLAKNINVYEIAVVGAIYEILWLPFIGAPFLVPLIALYFWYKERFRINSLFLLSLLLALGTIFWLVRS